MLVFAVYCDDRPLWQPLRREANGDDRELMDRPDRRKQDKAVADVSVRVARLLSWIDARPLRALALILMLAFALALPFVRIHAIGLESGETGNWWPIIDSVAHGRGYRGCFTSYFPFCGPTNDVTATREPASVLLFAGVGRLTRDSFRAAQLVQILLNLAVTVGVFFLARELARNTRIALFAALLWALYLPPARSEITQVTSNLLATACVTWGVFLFLRARRTGRAYDWLTAGTCLGIGALSRSALSVIPLVLAFGSFLAMLRLPHVSATRRLRSLGLVALLLLAFGTVLCPWFIRNYVAFGRPVLGSTLTGYDLYRENSLLPTETYLHFVAGSEADAAVSSLLARRTDLTGMETEAQMDAVYRNEALRIIKVYPARYVMLSLARFPMLWFDWTVPRAYGFPYSTSDYVVWCQQALLLLTALIGSWDLGRRAWPLAMNVAVVTLLYMAVIGRLYLLFPVMPLVVVLSADGCAWLWSKWRGVLSLSRKRA